MINIIKSFKTINIKYLNLFLVFLEIYKNLLLGSVLYSFYIGFEEKYLTMISKLFYPIDLIGENIYGILIVLISCIFLLEKKYAEIFIEGKYATLFNVFIIMLNILSWATTLLYLIIFVVFANF